MRTVFISFKILASMVISICAFISLPAPVLAGQASATVRAKTIAAKPKTAVARVIPLEGEASFVGTSDDLGIHTVVRHGMGDFKACYDFIRKKKPKIFGRLEIQWAMNPNGDVVSAAVTKDTMKSRELETCVVATLKKWSFPGAPLGQRATVVYPFYFSLR